MNKIAGSLVIISYTALLILMAASGHAQEWGKVSAEEWQTAAPADYPDANALVLFKNGLMEIDSKSIELTTHVRIKILNKAGINEVGDIDIPYFEDDKLKNLKAHTIEPSGKITEVDSKSFFTKETEGVKFKSFSFPALDSGCIVEYIYTNSNKRFVQPDPWTFQDEIYTIKSQIEILVLALVDYKPVLYQVPRKYLKPRIDTTESGLVSYVWVLENLPPIKHEPFMSNARAYRAALYSQLSSIFFIDVLQTWQDWGELLQNGIDSYVSKREVYKTLADSLTLGLTTAIEKAEKVYNFINREIEEDPTVGGTKGLGKLKDCIATKRGSREAKNLLMIELLKGCDIPAWPFLICTRDAGIFMSQLCQIHQFNRTICVATIDSELVYLDASPYCPFGVLPPESRTNGGLLIDGKNSGPLEMRVGLPMTLFTDATNLSVSSEGMAYCTTSVELTGYFAIEAAPVLNTRKLEDYVKDEILDRLRVSYVLDSASAVREDGTIRISIYYRIEDFARRLDNNIFIEPLQFWFSENPFASQERFTPVDFNYGRTYQSMVRVNFQDSIDVITLPPSKKLEITGATFFRDYVTFGNMVQISSQLSIPNPFFPQPQYPRIREFFSQLAASTEEHLSVLLAQ